ncbi:hypothetical protein LSH36_486g02011 [Paralvinella palmiformis]|uniref:non-specific serine/threonine protein kinase n=1 Tax=Paralvinella palmiformis TaxID=53620 RepID=A0AAD9MWU6_9ANNE|nr:hypothetical protein LSH36_486g02011 [Paralvinella palmiformis]
MGNQLTGIAPSQILPVEHYLTDIPDSYQFDTSLGSTRFFKVARARCREGLAVVKVFVIHDPSLPLSKYKDDLEEIKGRLQGASNCLPFEKSLLSDKAALLFRQYVKDSLYDRISTRPFLNNIEKKWLAFQLLCALNQCHKLGVCHGDIKSENVMVTSWTWLLLTDFASFKPTYLPEDNPADFSYYFDTSRRRTCYIAPERFVKSSWRNSGSSDQAANLELTTSEVKKGDLTPAMDIFSAGCVIAELFTEGTPPFDLSQLLSYRTGEYSPHELYHKIEDFNIRSLVEHMTLKDAAARDSAEEYLIQQQDKAFPKYFYTFLKLYLQRFASIPIMPSDDRIARVKRDLPLILKHLDVDITDPSHNVILVIVISLVTSSLRNLQFCNSKLMSLDVMLEFSKYVTSDIILDRLIPYMLYLVNDAFAHVRAEAVRTITQCLASVKTVPLNDANTFPEYILPQLSNLTQDDETLVRVAYAENIAMLAETALRFLEIVQLNSSAKECLGSESDTQTSLQYKASYDMELQALHEMIQQKVVTLLSDHDNIVKETLLQNGITRLCVFFGRQKANDVLLSHMITFLNDKYDWHLRGSFFEAIVGVAAYVGWQSSTILKPLLQQGLSDVEEFVIYKTLRALAALTELNLLQKAILQELINEVVPFLSHPNLWIRHGAAGFVAAVARILNIADVHCKLVPAVAFYLKQMVIQMDKEVLLLNALKDSIPRPIYDYILRSQQIDQIFEVLQDRQLIRSICRPGHQPNYGEPDETLAPLFRKLTSQGLTAVDEDKLLTMKDFMLKIHKVRAGSSDSSVLEEESYRGGSLNLTTVGRGLTIRHADLYMPADTRTDPQSPPVRKSLSRKNKQLESPGALMVQEGVSQEMEVARAVGQMKSGKVGGLTQLVSEIIPAAGQAVVNKIMKICDLVMDEGMVPEDWELSFLIPIYKEKGDPLECGPYWLEHAIWIYAWKGMIDAIFMNEDWKQMFGTAEMDKNSHASTTTTTANTSVRLRQSQQLPPSIQQQQQQQQQSKQQTSDSTEQDAQQGIPQVKDSLQTSQTATSSSQSSTNSLSQSTVTVSLTQLQSSTESNKNQLSQGQPKEKSTVQIRYASCKVELRNLVYNKRDQYMDDLLAREILDTTPWEIRTPPPSWKPKGKLVAHLHEHRGAVNRIQVSSDGTYFATCSNDGTVKLWDCSRMEGKSVTNRSRHTYNKQGGQIKTITFCNSSQCVASSSDSGAIHVFRIESSGQRMNILHTKNLDVESEGLVVDMTYFDTGSQNVVCYTTVYGYIVGWDLRTPKLSWKLQNDPKQGLITSFNVHRQQSWLAVGTSNGIHACWDLRFQLPITSVAHPTGARVRRLVTHSHEQSCILSAVQGNNEVSLWDMETGARQRTLWASSAPPLSTSQTSSHSAHGLYLCTTDNNHSFLLTGGSDMRIRYWDLNYPANSFIVANAARDPVNPPIVSYRCRLIDGTEVIQETYSKSRAANNEDMPRRGPESPAEGHHDIISDVSLCQTSQCFLISCSRDGVVKVWK